MKNEIRIKERLNVLELLKCNVDYFITGKFIVDRTNLKNKVELRQVINDLRNNGQPIISSSLGYKYTYNIDELLKCSNQLKNRARSILNVAENMLDIIK